MDDAAVLVAVAVAVLSPYAVMIGSSGSAFAPDAGRPLGTSAFVPAAAEVPAAAVDWLN